MNQEEPDNQSRERNDVSFAATMAATVICRSLPLSARSLSGPSFRTSDGDAARSAVDALKKIVSAVVVNVAPKRRLFCEPSVFRQVLSLTTKRLWDESLVLTIK
jgi:hypothetical protein